MESVDILVSYVLTRGWTYVAKERLRLFDESQRQRFAEEVPRASWPSNLLPT